MYVSWRVYRSPCLNNAAASLNLFNYILITRKKKKTLLQITGVFSLCASRDRFLTIFSQLQRIKATSANISNQP